MEICLAGTGGMLPLKERWLTCCYIEHNGSSLLIDCGEGTQIALAEYGCKLSRIETLLITHCHADHISGLPGLLLSMGNSSRTRPLDIFIPQGGRKIVEKLCCICCALPYGITVHELSVQDISRFDVPSLDSLASITSLPLKHSVPCLGYSLEIGKKPVFLPERAEKLGIPVKLWSSLHKGESVTLDTGRTVLPQEVLGESRKGIKITYVTDTLPFDGIAELAEGSDLFICEGMYGETDKKESMDCKGHMLMQDACRLAEKAVAERLWLTHYSPAEKRPERFENELKEIFPAATVSRDGQKISLK
ncbi:MAG: ribonuclease Z [Ruminococcus sp.]|nr:ribonuclease Z [Ruminococcus sp.]